MPNISKELFSAQHDDLRKSLRIFWKRRQLLQYTLDASLAVYSQNNCQVIVVKGRRFYYPDKVVFRASKKLVEWVNQASTL